MIALIQWIGKILPLLIFIQLVFADDIFVVSDVYGIKPDGSCNEIKGGHFGELKLNNVHWNANNKTIKLYGAKNEEVAVQIVIPQSGKGFWANMSNLEGPSTIQGGRATFSAMAWTNHKQMGMCPDLVIPIDGSINGIDKFDIPISFKGIPNPGNTTGLMLFEVWIPKTIATGQYTGTLTVMAGETELQSLKVELTVYDFALPDRPNFAFDLLAYGAPSRDLGFDGRINRHDGLGTGARMVPEEIKKIDYQIYKLAMDNRCFVNVLPYSSQRGHPRYAYPIVGKGENARIMSYKEWDDYFGPVLNGQLNKFGEPPAHFLLAFNINYPYLCESEPANQLDFYPYEYTILNEPGRIPDLREFEETYRTIAEQYMAHFAEQGWTDITFQIYNNQKSRKDRNRTPWNLDEPVRLADYKGLGYLLNLAEWAFESADEKGITIKRRLDIGHFNCDKLRTPEGHPTRCGNSKDYNRHNADKYLKNVVDHWTINSFHLEGAHHLLNEYQTEGKKVISYTTSGSQEAVGLHSGHFAGEGFKSARIGIKGRVIYKLGMNKANPNKQDASTHSILYSGMPLGFEGALPSHRLKLWRNAVNDYDYIVSAKAVDDTATMNIVQQMTTTGATKPGNPVGFWFTNNVEDIIPAKAKLAEIITGEKIEDMEIKGFSDEFTPCGAEDNIVGYD